MLFYAVICWETQGVKLHFRCEKHSSVSKTGLSTLQTTLWKKLSENQQWGSELVFLQLDSYTIPVGKVQSSHQTGLAILLPVMAVKIESIFQTKTCSFHKESNFQLYPVRRSFSNYEKGYLLPNHHQWSWIVPVWQKGEIIIL